MERTVALKKLEKLIGKKMAWRINPKAPTPDERAAARLALPPAIAERDTLRKQQTDRQRAILEGDEEYQRLIIATKEASAIADRLSSLTRAFKITVGDTSSGLFFMVKAEGDSWEDVIAKLTAKKS